MSDLRKLLTVIDEKQAIVNETVAGCVASVAMPLGSTHKRVEEAPEMPEVLQFGNWENTALSTGNKTKAKRKKKATTASIYGEQSKSALKEGVEGMTPIDFDTKPSFKSLVSRYNQLTYQGHEGDYTEADNDEANAIEKYVLSRFGDKGLSHLLKAAEVSFWGRDDGRGMGGVRSSNLGQPSKPAGEFRTTATGKMHKQDAGTLKQKLKNRIGSHPSPQLAEEDEKIADRYTGDEFDEKVKRLKAKAQKNPVDTADLARRMQAAYKREDEKQGVDEGYDKWGWHTSVTNGEFMPTKYGNKAYVYLHDMDNQSANGNPQLVTVNKPAVAKKIAQQFGGKAVKTDLNTYRIVKPAEQEVAEGSLNEGQYEMMMRNGQVKKFIAKDDDDAKRIAKGHGAKSVIKLRGGVPAGKVSEQGVEEASPETTLNLLKGLKSWQVVIMNNYYRGKYSDYSGRYYYVLASSPEEAKQVVLDNADAILQDLLSMKSVNGKKILPRGSAIAITDKRIGDIKDGTEAGRMTTAGYKKMFGPSGPMMVKLTNGAVVDVQGEEQDVAESSEERSQNRLWQMITDYEQRAKATKNDIKKQHLLRMAQDLRSKLQTTDDLAEDMHILPEAELSEEQLLASELKKRLDLFNKGADHDLGDKPQDREVQKKVKESDEWDTFTTNQSKNELTEGSSDYVGNAIEDLRYAKPGLDRETFLDELYSYLDAQFGKRVADMTMDHGDENVYDEWFENYSDMMEGKTGPGLWANIHAKRERIKHGSGERMRKPGSKGAPTAQNFKDAASEGVAEGSEQSDPYKGTTPTNGKVAARNGHRLGKTYNNPHSPKYHKDSYAAWDRDYNSETARLKNKGVAEDILEETYHGDEFYEAYGELWYDEEQLNEAEYRGRKVPLGKPMRGDVKKFKVYVKDPSTGNIKKVNFGDPNMRIKKSNPARRKSFRARHHCENPGPKTSARYWSCRKW